MTTIKHMKGFTAVIDHENKKITLRTQKAGPDQLVLTRDPGKVEEAIKKMGLNHHIDHEGYRLVEA